jgi:hypothetical protein
MDIEQAIDHRTFFVWERQPPLKGGYPSEKGVNRNYTLASLDFAVFSFLPTPVAKQAEARDS